MSGKRIKSLTLTILTDSNVALSNDMGNGGNYTPVKKMYYKDGTHLFCSVGTMTYELRRNLHKNLEWQMFDVVLNKPKVNKPKDGKITNVFNKTREDNYCEEKKEWIGNEADLFGYLLPGDQISRTAPLKVIPPISLGRYHTDTQTITNRGFLNLENGRSYIDQNGKPVPCEDVPNTQALFNEEIMGDWYRYTITIELDRVGRIETEIQNKVSKKKSSEAKETESDGKDTVVYLAPNNFKYKNAESRKKMVTDLLETICHLTRTIKNQTVHLKPKAVFGGLFDRVVPYFSTDIEMKDGKLALNLPEMTIDTYKLAEKGKLIKAVAPSPAVEVLETEKFIRENLSDNPVKEILDFAEFITEKVKINEDNLWYIEEK